MARPLEGRILIGDDNAKNVKRWIELNELFHWYEGDLVYADTPNTFLDLARARKYDALITDVNYRVLHENDGFRILESMKEEEGFLLLDQCRDAAPVRILWATGAKNPHFAKRARLSGATHLLSKTELDRVEEILLGPVVDRILVGDDDLEDAKRWIAENRALVWFRGAIDYCRDPETLVRLAHRKRRDRLVAIITDLSYGKGREEDGFRVLERVKDRCDIRVLWARDMKPEKREMAVRAGATHVVDKHRLGDIRGPVEAWQRAQIKKKEIHRKVLIVSEEEAYRENLAEILIEHFDVVPCGHAEALDRAAADKFTHICVGDYDVATDDCTTFSIPRGSVTLYKLRRKLMDPETKLLTMGRARIGDPAHFVEPVNVRLLVARIWGPQQVKLLPKDFRTAGKFGRRPMLPGRPIRRRLGYSGR